VGNVGRIEVKALDWSQPEQREAFADTKWDYILAAGGLVVCKFSAFAPCTSSLLSHPSHQLVDACGILFYTSEHADCIYHEHIIEGLLQTCLRLCTPKTTGATLQECRMRLMPVDDATF
jgi:hypothetical protein